MLFKIYKKNRVLIIFILIIIFFIFYFFVRLNYFEKENIRSIAIYDPDYSFKMNDNKENIELEWYSSYVLFNDLALFFSISANDSNKYFLKLVLLGDKYSKVINKEIGSIDQDKNMIIFDNDFIEFDKNYIYFKYKSKDINISLKYLNINKGFSSKRSEYEEYFQEYHVLAPRSKVVGYIKLENNAYLINDGDGIGYFDHMWGSWPERKWVWGWIPINDNKSLIFAYNNHNKDNNIIKDVIILSDEDKILASDIRIENLENKIKIYSKLNDIFLSYNIKNDILEGFNPSKIDYEIKLKDQVFKTQGIIEYMNIID